jgi:hypothetical protein
MLKIKIMITKMYNLIAFYKNALKIENKRNIDKTNL